MGYKNYTDDELISLIRKGEQDATEYLLKRYTSLVKKSTRTLYIIGADTEDLSQEGMIGLFKAIQTFEPNQDATFYSYAKLCIERQIYSAIKASNRKKHLPLNSYVSLNTNTNKGENELIDNLVASNETNPEHIVLVAENSTQFQKEIENHLSSLEKKVLQHYLDGMSYADISISLRKPVKSIDNTIQRIRNKIKNMSPSY
ncbi:MAG: RNA polymerase sporulation sigma factor SigH [Eubacteriales bacterium]|nr:RNA polymerase sporulation sigma factor SigH [Eubacteriales bacterium]